MLLLQAWLLLQLLLLGMRALLLLMPLLPDAPPLLLAGALGGTTKLLQPAGVRQAHLPRPLLSQRSLLPWTVGQGGRLALLLTPHR